MLTHANIFANVVQMDVFLYSSRSRDERRFLIVIPYFHIYAFTVGMMTGIWVGALQVLLPKYDLEMMLTAIRDFRPTFVPAVPTVWVSLLNHPRVISQYHPITGHQTSAHLTTLKPNSSSSVLPMPAKHP